jgi:hypothetical protein
VYRVGTGARETLELTPPAHRPIMPRGGFEFDRLFPLAIQQ